MQYSWKQLCLPVQSMVYEIKKSRMLFFIIQFLSSPSSTPTINNVSLTETQAQKMSQDSINDLPLYEHTHTHTESAET